MRRLIVGLLACGLLACQTTLPPRPEPFGAVTVPDWDEKALILLITDRQVYESFVVSRVFEAEGDLALELAWALGRSGHPEGRVVLERLLVRKEPEIRKAAIFGLGELEQPLSKQVLLHEAAGPDTGTGALAVEALAKLDVELAEVMEALAELDEGEQARRVAPYLFRFDKSDSLLLAARWLDLEAPDLHAWAAYALARGAIPEAAPWLRTLLRDPNPWVRGWAARALGSIGEGQDLLLMQHLLSDGNEGPVIQVLRASQSLIEAGKAAPPRAWRDDLLRLAEDPRPGVRITALEAMGVWLLDDELSAVLIDRFERGSPRERQVALHALAGAADPRAEDVTYRAAADRDLALRRRAPAAAVELGLSDLAIRMMSDVHEAVRAAAAAALLQSDLIPGVAVAETAIEDPARAVRTAALRWLVDEPVLPTPVILEALRPGTGDRSELTRTAVQALSARGQVAPAEMEQLLEVLEEMTRSSDFLVRREAAVALELLGATAEPVGAANEMRELDVYRDIVLQTSKPVLMKMETTRGDVTLRLTCPEVPLTCLSFRQLAIQGFYDGLPFHRVVPDFVVQAGDPSGGGWGGPGYSLRDEINGLRYEVGVLGMASVGPDTAGSQFFITLSKQPHLDGSYTSFGWVEDGMEVLYQLEQEDRIVRIREIPMAESGSG